MGEDCEAENMALSNFLRHCSYWKTFSEVFILYDIFTAIVNI